jgi:transcriptional regulator with XRE-family HTH domain
VSSITVVKQYLTPSLHGAYKKAAMSMVEPFYVEVGRRIQKLRSDKKLSQAALGRLLIPQVTRASIANIEMGKQRILAHTLVQLAEALETQLTNLLPPQTQTKRIAADTLEAEFAKKLNLPPQEIKKLTAKVVRATRSKKQ